MNEQHAFLRGRYSVRKFQPQPVVREVLERILETTTWSPSAHNAQPWRFVLLESEESREQLGAALGKRLEQALMAEGMDAEAARARFERSRLRIAAAPLGILICVDAEAVPFEENLERQAREYQMAVQSAALAGGTLLLAAHAEGLEGVWLCAPLFQPELVRTVLDLPQSWHPQGLLLMGIPDEQPQPRERIKWQDVTLFR
jgi:coenzyme F420-0:L-glutamate ligase/coenzyme F420-1:gamma-L-glutamate ligase